MDGDSTASLGDQFQCLTTLTVKRKNVFSYVKIEFPLFQFVPIESCHWAPLNFVFSLALPLYSPPPSGVLAGRTDIRKISIHIWPYCWWQDTDWELAHRHEAEVGGR